MYCPFCTEKDTKVIDSRLVASGLQVRRRRECGQCGERFTTFETAELVMPKVIKTDGTRQPFDELKLRSGISKAIEKRPVSVEKVEEAITAISSRLRAIGEREILSTKLGEYVMDALRAMDEVAYVRFASVYRDFKDVDAFRKEIEALKQSQSDK